jgi:hypothetical protein
MDPEEMARIEAEAAANKATDDLAEEIAEEIADEMSDETLEEISSDAVAIAAIEADKEIQIAEIQAEVETARIEAETERERTWQEEVETLRTNMQELAMKLEAMEAARQSTPEPLTEAAEAATEIAEAEAANNSTPQFMSPPISETQTEVTLESADGRQEAKASVTTRKRRRLI